MLEIIMHHAYNTKEPAQNCAHLLRDFTNALVIAESKGEITEKDFKKLQKIEKNLKGATITYFKKSGIKKDVMDIVNPLLNGEFDNLEYDQFMLKMQEFDGNLKLIVTNLKKEYKKHKTKKLAEKIESIEEIQKDFHEKFKDAYVKYKH